MHTHNSPFLQGSEFLFCKGIYILTPLEMGQRAGSCFGEKVIGRERDWHSPSHVVPPSKSQPPPPQLFIFKRKWGVGFVASTYVSTLFSLNTWKRNGSKVWWDGGTAKVFICVAADSPST